MAVKSQKGIKTIRAEKQNKTKISLWKNRKGFGEGCHHQGFPYPASNSRKMLYLYHLPPPPETTSIAAFPI